MSNFTYLIVSGCTAETWFARRKEIYLRAKEIGINSYILGNNTIPEVANLEDIRQSDTGKYRSFLKIQNRYDELRLIEEYRYHKR